MRRVGLLLAASAALLLAVPAAAEARIVVKKDNEGRPITFDVRAAKVDVNWYARTLRRALHGDEITHVKVRIVARNRVPALCGKGAEACYKRNARGARIIVPKGRGPGLAATLFHEYAHHLDLYYRVDGVGEPNGTASWWAARGMDGHVAAGRAMIGYKLGWKRAAGEVFAENYARLHVAFRWQIRWIGAPKAPVFQAIRADLAAGPDCGRRCGL